MKIEMTNFGAVFNLHCPRCGNKEFSEEEYRSTKTKIYHKCMHCGSDICTDTHTRIGIVIEDAFTEFTPLTYDEIKGENGLKNSAWKIPEKEEIPDGGNHEYYKED